MSAQDQRNLYRLSQKFGSEVSGEISIDGNDWISVKVLDYHSGAVGLKLVGQPKIDYVGFRLLFGSTVIAQFESPKILRHDLQQNLLVLSLTETNRKSNPTRKSRISVNRTHFGSLSGLDPFKLQESIHFQILNVSIDGCRILSSKSNRHLTSGMKLNNFNIVLPGLGIYKVDFEIRNTLLTENGIEFGGVLTSEEKGFDRSFRKYLLLNSNFDLEKEPDAFRSIISNYRDFGPLIRMVPVQTNEQFEEILKRRLSAYRAANKVDSDQGWQEMRDEYDKNAINYSIQIGTTVVGTIRIIFSENGSRFPFEEYFKWDSNPLLQKSERSQVAEISRLAIDPVFQGSDIFLIAFRNIIVEIGQKRIAHPVCLATDDVAVHYKRIGAIKIGGPFPHKVMKNSDLNFYLFDPTRIVAGKMGALGWFKVAKPAVHHLFKYGFIKRPALGFLNTLLLPFEAISFLARRKLSKIRRSVRSGRAAK